MHQADNKPYTRYHAGRVRRPRTDAPLEPAPDSPSPKAPSPRRADTANGGRGAGGAGAARAARAQDEPASIYRADRRAQSRTEGPDLALVPGAEHKRRLFHWWYLLAIPLALAIAVGVWGFLGYSTFNRAVVKANQRINATTRAALVDPHGGVLSAPTTLLVLGSDQRGHEPARSDSILLMRFDPHTHTVSQLSIPRDTLVNVPGHGQTKINEAYFWGGPALAVKVVSSFTGVPVNHVMLVNFHGFPALVNSVGGVVVDVPHDLTSWYSGNITVHFKKGPQLMNGKQALIYSRVRHSDSDFMRMGRQQQVVQALEQKITRPRNVLHLPWTGARFMAGVGTDLTTNQIIELAYLEWRAKGTRQQKTVLPGTPQMIGGGSYVVVDPAVLARTVRQFLNR
jgi:LCP family protein required for cell wall assembly